ncbi:MAG: formate dehydrogenase accessory sulfurtransferase FdhD [Pseudomonadota bacterium]|nr:formate dehydrogenase accessory sulfurtransferase FdhD [Pseudomonadota bacterium]
MSSEENLIMPDPKNPLLTEQVTGADQNGNPFEISVTVERPLTLFLNNQEIVTMMSICDYPEYMAIGYLVNQNMLLPDDEITGIDYDEDIDTIVVRTARNTNYEEKLKKKTLTSGCAQGTVFGDVLEKFEDVKLPTNASVKTSWLFDLIKKINIHPSLYLEAGAIHGCVLAKKDKVLLYMEDVGRHNAIDKVAGYMFKHGIDGDDKIFYTTGRLTSEMIIKTVQMGIPILASRSGFTAWGVELARKVGLTLIGRVRGKRFVVLSGEDNIIYDATAESDLERVQLKE